MVNKDGYQALYNKYRPQRFADVFGQESVVKVLQNELAHNRASHAYLFSGERGTGKTTLGRLLAKALNCQQGMQPEPCNRCNHCTNVGTESFLDLIEIDAASNTSVDDIRDLRDKVRLSPSSGRFRIYLIDEVHQLSRAAYNAFLKTLEEPPPHVIFILATTDPHRVLPTVRSRCQHLRFRRLTIDNIVQQLIKIVDGESASADAGSLQLIAANSDGSMRDAIGTLEQALAYSQDTVTEQSVREMLGLSNTDTILEVIEAMSNVDISLALQILDNAVAEGANPATLRESLAGYFRILLLIRTGRMSDDSSTYTDFELSKLKSVAPSFPRLGMIVTALECLIEDPRSVQLTSSRLQLELSIVRICLSLSTNLDVTADPAEQRSSPNANPEEKKAPPNKMAAQNLSSEQPDSTPSNASPADHADHIESELLTDGEISSDTVLEGADKSQTIPVNTDTDVQTTSPSTQVTENSNFNLTGSQHKADMASILDRLVTRSDQLQSELKKWGPMFAPFAMDADIFTDEESIVFLVPYSAHLDVLSKTDNLTRLRQIVSNIVGESVSVRVELADRDSEYIDPNENNVENKLVDTAINIYGAEIIKDPTTNTEELI